MALLPALTETETKIGELGSQLAQAHYALTTDHEGALPMRPTDADRQKLVELLGRAYDVYEEQRFEAGYRESYLRLVGNGNGGITETPAKFDPVLHAELFTLVAKYGIVVPPEGTPERDRARLLFSDAIADLKENMRALLHEPEADTQDDDKNAAAGLTPVRSV